MRAVAHRQHVGRAVADPHAGPGGGHLHHRPWRGRRPGGPSPAGRPRRRARRCSRRCRSAARCSGRRAACTTARDRRGAVRAEDRLRCLDLHLEAQRAGGQPCAASSRSQSSTIASHLVDRGHLGQRDHEAGGQRRRRAGRARGRAMRTPRRRVGASSDLTRTPSGTASPSPASPASASPTATACRSSSSSGRSAVAVLEVDPQVLDRLAGQLVQHPRPASATTAGSSPVIRAIDAGSSASTARGRRHRWSPPRRCRGGRPAGRACAPAAGPPARPAIRRPAPVGRGEQLVQLGQHVVRIRGSPGLVPAVCSAASPSAVGVPQSRSRAMPPSG